MLCSLNHFEGISQNGAIPCMNQHLAFWHIAKIERNKTGSSHVDELQIVSVRTKARGFPSSFLLQRRAYLPTNLTALCPMSKKPRFSEDEETSQLVIRLVQLPFLQVVLRVETWDRQLRSRNVLHVPSSNRNPKPKRHTATHS